MPKPPPPKTRVLFVDDDHGFLQMVNDVFGQLGRESWEICQATNANDALKVLGEQPIDLVVLDLVMPGVGGMDLLKLIDRDFPNLQKVLLTGGSADKDRISGLEGGADLFLEKPANLAGLESVFATLSELARWQQKMGARGSVRPAGLLDIIRMECASGNSRLLEVSFENVKGQIYVKAGVIVHAETEGRRGQSAFSFLASRRDAEFNLKQFVEPPERSVDRQWEFLVMEAFRLQEQADKAAARGTSAATPASPTVPAPTARASKPVELVRPVFAPAPAAPARTPGPATAPATPAARPASAPAPAPPQPTVIVPAAVPAAVQLGSMARRNGIRVEETLVSSKQREVLYEVGISQSDARLKLLTFLSQESLKASAGLPAGKLQGLELQATDGRMVVRFQENTDVWIRTNSADRPAPGSGTRPKPTAEKWLEAIMEAKGVLAAGVTRPDLGIRNIPCYTDYTEDRLNAVWRWIGETFRMLNQERITAWQLRLIYENSQAYCLKRLDRFVFSAFITRDAAELDAPRVQELFNDFENLGSL